MYSTWNIPKEYKGACSGGDQVTIDDDDDDDEDDDDDYDDYDDDDSLW